MRRLHTVEKTREYARAYYRPARRLRNNIERYAAEERAGSAKILNATRVNETSENVTGRLIPTSIK